ncbi:hypothetical protein [Marinagarivorans algicola]|uniref:hypothetical protein n=1 Tax=Marinagarivorans algicola TaxID=1513270 RepID=UPI0006B63152|nr:hypothetical protein [Marinagarivorans algicola]
MTASLNSDKGESNDSKGVAGNVEVGAGEPVLTLAYTYTTKSEAKAAVKVHLRSSKSRSRRRLAFLDLIDIAAEGCLEVSGFDSSINGLWRIDAVDISVNSHGGLLSVSCDRVVV